MLKAESSSIPFKLLPVNSPEINILLDSNNIMGIVAYNIDDNKLLKYIPGNIPLIIPGISSCINNPYIEICLSEEKVYYGTHDNISYSYNNHIMWGSTVINSRSALNESIYEAYNNIFKLTEALGFNSPFRFWNYISGINNTKEGTERYQIFCTGRSEAYKNKLSSYPAATCIGSRNNQSFITFISAMRDNFVSIENPNQLPASKYRLYSDSCAPLFSRAGYININNSYRLFISGTASVIKSESKNINDIINQTKCTLNNISILINFENLNQYGITKGYTLNDINLIKVYIRNDNDYNAVKAMCDKSFSDNADILYLKADVCRTELLVEIEGII